MSPDKIELHRHRMRNSIMAEARLWLGTPYQHQAMLRNVGADCVGFVVGVGLAAGVLSLTKQDFKAYAGYGRLPNSRRMHQSLKKHLLSIHERQANTGDIVWLQWREGLPMHLAIIGTHSGQRTLLHAAADVGRVVEHALTQQWDERIVSFWRYPGVG